MQPQSSLKCSFTTELATICNFRISRQFSFKIHIRNWFFLLIFLPFAPFIQFFNFEAYFVFLFQFFISICEVHLIILMPFICVLASFSCFFQLILICWFWWKKRRPAYETIKVVWRKRKLGTSISLYNGSAIQHSRYQSFQFLLIHNMKLHC